jgi:ankyrin repeat protein
MLLRHERIELSAKDDSGLSALNLSAIYGQWDIVQALLDHDEYGGAQTHVVQALEPHRIPPSDIVKRLLSHCDFRNINIRGTYDDGRFHQIGGLLHLAVHQGDCDMLRVLLNHKEIDVNCQSAYAEMTPLHLAAELGRKEIATLLLQHERISVDLRTWAWHFEPRETALQIAQRKGHAELAELLLVHGAVE